MAARITVGNLLTLYAADKSAPDAIAWLIGASLFPALFLFAGLRLWRGQGRATSTLASGLAIIDPLLFGHDLSTVVGVSMLIVRYLLVAIVLNGARGAFAINREPDAWTKPNT